MEGDSASETEAGRDHPSTPPTGGDDGSAAGSAMPSRRTAILRSGLMVSVLLLVFGVILPRFVDYREVISALAALTPPQVLLITLIGIGAWFCCGQLFTVLLDGLSPLRGMGAYLILSGMGPSLPFGPWNLGVVWVVIRGWGHSVEDATSSVALYGIINTLARFAMPLVALVVLLPTGGLGTHGNAVAIITVISIVIFFVATGVMIAVVQSDRTAEWVAQTIQRMASWLLARLRRSEQPDVSGSIYRFRNSLGEIVHRRGLLALIVTIAAQIPWMICFIVALRLTGVPGDVLTPGDVIAIFALVSVITIIPIAPGGAGVPELLYIGGLTALAGPEWNAQITAGVFLFRLYVWFLPIPLSWILLKVVRRGRPILPTAVELRSYAATAPG
ncbi:MAG: YbhN family protein [Chloroflexota bacterium]